MLADARRCSYFELGLPVILFVWTNEKGGFRIRLRWCHKIIVSITVITHCTPSLPCKISLALVDEQKRFEHATFGRVFFILVGEALLCTCHRKPPTVDGDWTLVRSTWSELNYFLCQFNAFVLSFIQTLKKKVKITFSFEYWNKPGFVCVNLI